MHGNWVSLTLSSAQHFLFKFSDGKRGNLVNNKELKDKDTNIIGLSRRMVFWVPPPIYSHPSVKMLFPSLSLEIYVEHENKTSGTHD
jgi:hypothetical protein